LAIPTRNGPLGGPFLYCRDIECDGMVHVHVGWLISLLYFNRGNYWFILLPPPPNGDAYRL